MINRIKGILEDCLNSGKIVSATLRRELSQLAKGGLDFPIQKHPLGFYKSTLAASDNEELRLHYWSEEGLGETLIHNHTWNLLSVILLGELRNITYSVDQRDSGSLLKYRIDYKTGGSVRLPEPGRFEASLKSSRLHRRGDFYRLGYSEFHQSEIVSQAGVLTLVLAQQVPAASAYVLSGDVATTDFPEIFESGRDAERIRHRICSVLLEPE